MEGVGITKALKKSQRMIVAAMTANKTESSHSRNADFLGLVFSGAWKISVTGILLKINVAAI
jgi:hypothetical protein